MQKLVIRGKGFCIAEAENMVYSDRIFRGQTSESLEKVVILGLYNHEYGTMFFFCFFEDDLPKVGIDLHLGIKTLTGRGFRNPGMIGRYRRTEQVILVDAGKIIREKPKEVFHTFTSIVFKRTEDGKLPGFCQLLKLGLGQPQELSDVVDNIFQTAG